MTNRDHHGAKVKSIYWPGENGGILNAGDACQLQMCYSDNNEKWILQIKDGVEIARHNVSYLQAIVWEPA